MNIIVNVRGGSGSGKTTCVRKFLETLPYETLRGPKLAKPEKYEIKGYRVDAREVGLQLPVYLIGPYEPTLVSGGCDNISTQAEIGDRIIAAYEAGGHVLCEGLLMSKSGVQGHIANRLRPHRHVFAYLDTPVEVACERVLNRRAARGADTANFDLNRTVIPGLKGARSAYEAMLAANAAAPDEPPYRAVFIDHRRAAAAVLDLLLEAERV